MSRFLRSCCILLFCSLPLMAFAAPQESGGGAKKDKGVTVKDDETPLSQVIRNTKDRINAKIQEKIRDEKQNGNGKSACEDETNSANDEEKLHRVSKACHVPQFKAEKDQTSAELHGRGNKVIGKRVKTKTKLYFDRPDQRAEFGLPPGHDPARWEDFNYQGRPDLPLVGPPGSQAANLKVKSALLPASEGVNNDKDCVDRATGKRLGGYIRDENGNRIENPESCFDTTGPMPVLKQTLTRQDDGTCIHASGRIYSADECDDIEQTKGRLTTLEELIDEDVPAHGGRPAIDGDQDGNVDDTPELNSNSLCAQNDGDSVAGSDSCDLTQAARRRLNQQALNDERIPPGQRKKLFKINDAGACDDTAEGEYSCGQEPREIELEETVEVRCPPGAEYKDGLCATPIEVGPNAAAPLLLTAAAGSPGSVTQPAMMGFTFAPPVIEWGIKEQDNVCIFGFCFEIFYLRFGYEFSVAAGLRLPVQVTVSDVPANVTVGQEHTLNATLQPVDFKVNDYVSFCQEHHLDRSWWIADCNRFAFPEFFESLIPDSMFNSPGDRQGSEFVAEYTVFAGLQIRIFSIPVVNFAIDSSVNLPAMCTLYKMKKEILDGGVADWIRLAANFGKNLQDTRDFMSSLESTLTNCASFTTPYGYEGTEPRQFPFLTGSFDVPADCTRELIEGKAVSVGGESKPMCTGLKVTIYGATLGLGLQLVPAAYSDLIKANASVAGDAAPYSQTLDFHQPAGGDSVAQSIGPLTFDNYDPASDVASLKLNNFTYYLNNFSVQVNGLIELGGLLAFIGNVATVPLVNLTFDAGDYGIPIPQHPGTGPVSVDVPVTNYALTVNANTRPDDPLRVDEETLSIKPGNSGAFEVRVKNEGTVPDTFDNFTSAIPANWTASFSATSVPNVPKHSVGNPVLLTIAPYRHPLTKPGDYPVRITADSRTARELRLPEIDPSNLPRIGAPKLIKVNVLAFFDPTLSLTPSQAVVKPGNSVTYTVEVGNGGNAPDQLAVQTAFPDSDIAGCGLTANGSSSACPYRAQITRIDSVGWTTVSELDAMFPIAGSYEPLGKGTHSFTVAAPADWAGMQDTVYEFTLTATSTADKESPPAKNQQTARFTILATKESMTRYVNLEVAEFLAEVSKAKAQGVATRGIEPVLLHPVTLMTRRALEQILAGDLGGASKSLGSAIKVVEAVDHMVSGAGLTNDWKARSTAILADMAAAQGSMITSR